MSHQKPESNEQRQNGLKMVDQAIWSKKMSNGVRRSPASAEQVCLKRDSLQVNLQQSNNSVLSLTVNNDQVVKVVNVFDML